MSLSFKLKALFKSLVKVPGLQEEVVSLLIQETMMEAGLAGEEERCQFKVTLDQEPALVP